MKLCLISGLIGTLSFASLCAEPENFNIVPNPTNPSQPLKVKWWGNPGVYYVVEGSFDLHHWGQFFYAVKGVAGSGGTGQYEALEFSHFSGTDKAFMRLKGESDPFSLLALTDHDGDGIATALELDAGMDAVVAESFSDSDSDSMGDYWEIFYFGDLTRDGEGDFDGDGILDKFEWQAGTNPTVDDTIRSALRDDFSYDDRGWLSTYQLIGSKTSNHGHDAEGNITQQN